MLSRSLSLLLLTGPFLLAGQASALPTTYYLTDGSKMTMINQACPTPVACVVPVTGSVTLDDDGLGNVTLTDVSLAHAPYQVGLVAFLSVVLSRPSITLGAGTVAGTGSLVTSAVFGATTLAQPGATSTCTGALFSCATFGLTPGVTVLPPSLSVNLGTWNFDATGSNLTAAFTYFSVTSPAATETLTLVAAIPEPGTAFLLTVGLVGMVLRRRAER